MLKEFTNSQVVNSQFGDKNKNTPKQPTPKQPAPINPSSKKTAGSELNSNFSRLQASLRTQEAMEFLLVV